MWENGIDIYSVRVIRTRTNLYFGVGAIQYFADIADQLTARGITSVLVVTGRSSYKRTGAWEVVEKILNSRKISYALYDRVTPNPTTMQADEATALGKGIRAQAVIAIGACACTGGVFQDCYNVVGGVDHVIPVDVYVPGCAAKPEAIIDGVVLALEVVKGKLGLRDMPQTTIFE